MELNNQTGGSEQVLASRVNKVMWGTQVPRNQRPELQPQVLLAGQLRANHSAAWDPCLLNREWSVGIERSHIILRYAKEMQANKTYFK